MKCENCNAHNAHAIIIDDRYVLCPRCLKILEELNQEYKDIVGANEHTLPGHIENEKCLLE